MVDPRGGSGRWCPDCGTALSSGATVCERCGLDYASGYARDAERANAEVHRLRAQIAQLTEQQDKWIEYRKGILAYAHGVGAGIEPARGAAGVASDAREIVANTSPFAVPGGQAPPVQQAPAVPPGSRFDAPTAPMFSPPTREAQPWPVGEPAEPPRTAMRPARRLTAPVLLGVAGAALFILAGIVFVAASWSVYGPGARMAILLAFAAVFAWLARTATRHGFTAVGGALGVVSAAFVGVGVYALTAGPEGPAPYTTAIAVLVAAVAGLGLTRLRIKAVGEVASFAVLFAVEAGAIEGAWRSSGATVGLATYAIGATLGGAAILGAKRAWNSRVQGAIATYGGMAIVFVAALVAVITPLSANHGDGLALATVVTSVVVCGAISAWRPAWGAGVFTGLVTIGALTTATMWSLTGGQLAVAFALAAVVVSGGLGRAPRAWHTPGLWGLLPGLSGFALALIAPALDGVPRAFTGLGLFGDWTLSWVGGLGWYGIALLLIAALPVMTSRWDHPALVSAAGAQFTAAGAFATGTVFLGLDAADVAAQGAAAAGVGLALAAGAQWFAAPLWGAKRVAPVRALAIGLATIGGLHGAAAVVESYHWTGQLVWGTVAIAVALLALAGATVRERHAAAPWSLVAVAGVAGWTWHVCESSGVVVVAATLAALLIASVATRLPAEFASRILSGCSPAYAAAAIGVGGGVIAAGASSFGWHASGASAGYGWALVLSATVAVSGPIMAILADKVGVDSSASVTRIVTGIGVLAFALELLARLQQGLADAGESALTIADAGAPALAALVGGAAYCLVAVAPWWRPARWSVGIGVVVLASLHGLLGLGRLTGEVTELWWGAGAILLTGAALGVAAKWVPKVTLAPAICLSSLVAPAALAPHHAGIALAAGAVLAAGVAWIARVRRGVGRFVVLLGGMGVMFVAAAAGLGAAGTSLVALGETWSGDDIGWEPWALLSAGAVTIGLLAWTSTRKAAGSIVALAVALMAGLTPAPVGWLVLAIVGALSAETAARWGRRLGLHQFAPLGVGLASVAWSAGALWTVAVALGTLALVSIWTEIRSSDGGTRTFALVLAPVAGSVSIFAALASLNVDHGVAATIAAGTALTIPLVAVAARLDSRKLVAIWVLGITSVIGPFLTADLGLAGLVVVLGCAAWFTLSTMGVRWARWVAFGGLSVATMLLAADVGIATLEAYTAAPALTMIVVGLWWLKRDARIRTYFALAPGLGAALIPSYLALAIHPQVFARTLALVGAALVLAIVGVVLRWFAPLLATAVTAVVVAVSQATAGESLLPLWLSVSIIGAVLFALALLAERIKAMR